MRINTITLISLLGFALLLHGCAEMPANAPIVNVFDIHQ